MRRLTAIFVIFIFVFSSVSVFAAEKKIKRFERSPFNMLREWFGGFGKRDDGSSLMKVRNRRSWINNEEIRERRRSIGGLKRGMGRYK